MTDDTATAYNVAQAGSQRAEARVKAIVEWLRRNPAALGTERGHVRFLWEGRKLKVATGETEDLL
ncbi:MAG: hypothetical protein ACUVX1_15715 [Chloroflexota bacterium]